MSNQPETLQMSFTFMQGLSSSMLTQGSTAVTRMDHAGDEGFYDTVVSKEEGSPQSTYEIIMVSLSGSLLLLVAISVAISALRRCCMSNYSSKNLSAPAVVENITVANRSSDNISTVDFTGPVCVSYISGKRTVSPARVCHL